jgi:hypothetical protein
MRKPVFIAYALMTFIPHLLTRDCAPEFHTRMLRVGYRLHCWAYSH